MYEWKQINVGYDREMFAVVSQMIKLPMFAYSDKQISHEFKVSKKGIYKIVVDWQSEDICSYDVYKKVEVADEAQV